MKAPILLSDASHAELEKAIAENHRQLFFACAISLGGKVVTGNGIEWTFINDQQASCVTFPALTGDTAPKELDRMMEIFRQQPPESAGYWSLMPAQPEDAGLLLLARGWQTGWQPCWMVMDTKHKSTHYTLPENIRITADNDTIVSTIKDLPYSEDGSYMSSSLLQQHPDKARRFIAYHDNGIIGHCCLFFSEGKTGVAGMYCVGVLPAHRNKGVGKALVLAACGFARQKGYRYVMLNANHLGRPVYESAGFEFLSYGITWWLTGRRYITHAPDAIAIRLAEAIGRGDIHKLDELLPLLPPEMLNKRMSNNMRWIELAVLYKQPASAEWLIAHGAEVTALDCWELGWKQRVTELFRKDPAEVNRRYFDWGATLLHIAAEKDDLALLETALAANPDLSIKDLHHDSTALGWAHFFKRPEQIAMLTSYQQKQHTNG